MNDLAKKLEPFLQQLGVDQSTGHKELQGYFGYFLTELLGEESISAERLVACYHAAGLKEPWRMSAIMKQSGVFVKTTQGWRLHRDVRARVATLLAEEVTTVTERDRTPGEHGNELNRRNVLVVHGRDVRLRDAMFQFLRALDLNPIEWDEAVARTGKGSPYVGEILDAAFGMAQAVLVLLTPDERVELRPELCVDDADMARERGFQPRPNVYIEAGMALARNEARTILLAVGTIRPASDILGRHIVPFNGDSGSRNRVVQRLSTAGCLVNTTREDWLTVGSFEVTYSENLTTARRKPERVRR